MKEILFNKKIFIIKCMIVFFLIYVSAGCVSSSGTNPSSETPKEYAIRLGLNQPKDNPEHYYLFSDNIPQDLINQHTEIHNYLIQIIGGYDRYVHITYERNGNNDNAISELNRLGLLNGNISSINDIHEIRSCLSGFSAFDIRDFKHDYSLCIQPNPLTDPSWSHDRAKNGVKYRYGIFHGWIHEYFHHYQNAHTFDRELDMPGDCCGLNDPVGAPAWWVEGAAGVFPHYFMNEYFDQLSFTIENSFAITDNDFGSLREMLRNSWARQFTDEKNKFSDPTFACGVEEETRENSQCDWFLMNMYLAYYINQNVNPPVSHPTNLNYGMQVVLVNLLEKMYSLEFEGSLQNLTNLNLSQFYDSYNSFMRSGNFDDPPPEGFFPDEPLSQLVDFLSIDSSSQ